MKVYLAERHSHVRSALKLLLDQEPGIQVIAEASTPAALKQLFTLDCPDLLLLDWDLAGSQEISINTLREECPTISIFVMSGQPDIREYAIHSGADGFIHKGSSPESLVHVVEGLRAKHQRTSGEKGQGALD